MTRILSRMVPALALAFALCIPLSASAEGIATSLQQRYDGVKTLKSAFTQTLTHKESGSKEVRKGTLLFRKPLLVRWETQKPHPELLVVGDKEIWNYLPEEEVAYRYPLDLVRDSRSIVSVITGQARLDQDFQVVEEGTEDGLQKLHLFPKEPVQSLTEAIVWVDAEAKLIKRARIYDFYGNENDIVLEDLAADAKLSDTSFTFTPPKGVDVEDRIKGGSPEKQLFN